MTITIPLWVLYPIYFLIGGAALGCVIMILALAWVGYLICRDWKR